MKKLIALVMVFHWGLSFAEFGEIIEVNTFVDVKTPARYTLLQGIDAAIQNVKGMGQQLTLANVQKELERMRDANDVDLPYERGTHSGKERQKKRDFDKMLANKVRNAVLGDSPPEPLPKDFKTRADFKNAYVQYKLAYIDEEVEAKYANMKFGGMNQYKRDMKAEAEAKWKSIFGVVGVNLAMPSKVQK